MDDGDREHTLRLSSWASRPTHGVVGGIAHAGAEAVVGCRGAKGIGGYNLSEGIIEVDGGTGETGGTGDGNGSVAVEVLEGVDSCSDSGRINLESTSYSTGERDVFVGSGTGGLVSDITCQHYSTGITVDFVEDAVVVLFLDQDGSGGGLGVFYPVVALLDLVVEV